MTCHRLAIVVCLAAATGCFDPQVRPGAVCGPQGECPPGQTCGLDGRCQLPGPGQSDAPPGAHDASIDAPPDAPPVACQRDADCATPPNACSLSGTCDLSAHACVFPAKDCSGQNTCGAFGSCQGANPQDVCDSGTKSQTCMDYTCQPSTGACVATPRTVTVDCNGITNGRACGSDGQQISCTSCNYNDVCDTEASQSCMFAREQCQSDVCVRQSNETRNLTCSRPGPANPLDACAPPTTGGCGECLNPSNACAATGGQQQCTVTHHGCVSGACGSIPGGSVSQSCTPGNQDGRICGICGAGEIGDWVCVSGGCVSMCHCLQDGNGVPFC